MSKVNKVNELISLRKKKKKKISQPRKKKKNERKYTYHSEKLKNFKFWRQNIIRLHTHICVHKLNFLIQDEDQFNSIYSYMYSCHKISINIQRSERMRKYI